MAGMCGCVCVFSKLNVYRCTIKTNLTEVWPTVQSKTGSLLTDISEATTKSHACATLSLTDNSIDDNALKNL